MAYARRTDTTHAPIRDALRRIGASVIDTHTLGIGFPDLVVGYRRRTFLVECKSDKRISHRVAQPESDVQRQLREAWRGDAWLVVYSSQEAIDAVSQVPA